MAEIIHRAIPKPVILIHADEGGGAACLSLAPKRAAERETGRVVTIEVHDTGPLSNADEGFATTLALPALPTGDLAALYTGLVERVEALAAARLAGLSGYFARAIEMVWATRLCARRSSGSRAFSAWDWLRNRSERALSLLTSSSACGFFVTVFLPSRRASRSASLARRRSASAWTSLDGL